MTVQLDDHAAKAVCELVKGKLADLAKAQDDIQKKIQEWENICAALVHPVDLSPQGPQIIAAPAPTTMLRPTLPPGAGADVKKEGAESQTLPAPSNTRKKTKKSMGRQFPYKLAQKYMVGKNTIWTHGDLVVIGRNGYDKKARLTVSELQNMNEERLRLFGNDKARAVLRVVLQEVDFSIMPPKAKAGAASAVQEKKPEPITEIKINNARGGHKLRAGNSGYVLCPEGIAIARDGYHHHVYLSYPDFFSLVENPARVDTSCAAWHKLKRSLLRGFLSDVTPEVVAQIRKARAVQVKDDPDEWKYKKILNVDTKVPREDYAKVEA